MSGSSDLSRYNPVMLLLYPTYQPVQRRVFLWLWLVSAAGGLAVVVFAFTGLEPRYRCRVSSCEVENYTALLYCTALPGGGGPVQRPRHWAAAGLLPQPHHRTGGPLQSAYSQVSLVGLQVI